MVTFETPDHHDVTMFDRDARTLLELMGVRPRVPGALAAGDVPAALERLRQAIAAHEEPPPAAEDEDDEEEPAVPLRHRALPLIELLATAAGSHSPVLWR